MQRNVKTFRCDDFVWKELASICEETSQTASSFICEAIVEKIQRIKKEEYIAVNVKWLYSREKKLQTIEQYFKNGRIDLDKLYNLVMSKED